MIKIKDIEKAFKKEDGFSTHFLFANLKRKFPCYAGISQNCRRRGTIYLVHHKEKGKYFGLFCAKCANIWEENNYPLEKLEKNDLIKIRFLLQVENTDGYNL